MSDPSRVPARYEHDPIDVITRPLPGHASPPPPSDEEEGPSVSLAQLWGYRWSMLLVFLLVTGAALPVVWTTVEPMYRGEAYIEVKANREVLVYHTPQAQYGSYWSFLNTQVGILTSPDILKRVAAREDVQATDWYQNPPESLMSQLRGPPAPYERLRDTLAVSPDGDSQLVLIAAETRIAEEGALLCNALAEEYLAYIKAEDEAAWERNLASLRTKEAKLKSELGKLQEEAARLAADLGMRVPDDLVTQQRLKLDELGDEIKKKQVEIEARQGQLARMRAGRSPEEAVATGGSKGTEYEADPVWQQIQDELRQARNDLAGARARFGPSNPQIAIQAEKVAAVERRLKDRETWLDAHPQVAVAATGPRSDDRELALTQMTIPELERFIQNLELDKQSLEQRLDADRAEFEATFAKAQRLNELNERVGRDGEVYDDVRRALTRRETERDAPERITLAAPAVVPARAHKDLRIKLSLAAIVGGLLAAFGLGFVRVRLNSSIQDFTEVAELRPLPMLGHLSPQKGTPRKAEEAIAQLDQVRMLRTTLLRRMMTTGRGTVIQITSAGPRSGKTTTSLALAASFRDCGRKVMLVDSDFRNPSVAARIGCDNTPGLLDLLRGKAQESDVLRDVDGITVLPTGTQNGVQAGDMLEGSYLLECFEKWREQYDLILLDGAPVLASADAAILAPQLDGTVMVVREQHCRRHEVLTALGRIEAAGGSLLGLVVIGRQKLTSYGYPSYGSR